MIKDKRVPTLRLPFFNTRSSTTGFRKVNSRQRKKKKPKNATTDKDVITLSLNQSSSCPFSKTYCKQPTKTISRPIPSQSISAAELFSPYFGLRTYNNVSNTAAMPMGMFIKKILGHEL